MRRSFCQIPGITHQTEAKLWSVGFSDWSDLLSDVNSAPLGIANRAFVQKHLEDHIEAFEQGDRAYFASALGSKLAWRAFSAFENECVYVDIETNGGNVGESITLIGAFDGQQFRGFVKFQNLEEFPDFLDQFKMIVTFFGESFDLPLIKKKFTELNIDHLHIDLCPALRAIGYSGGLKKIEKQLGVNRGNDVDGLNGLQAIQLWNRYQEFDDENAFRLLLEYNREDVVNLQFLARYATSRLERMALLGEEVTVKSVRKRY